MPSPLLKGSGNIQEEPSSPKMSFGIFSTKMTRTFVGSYDQCLAVKPRPGSLVPGFAGFVVDSPVEVEKLDGAAGRLTYSATTPTINSTNDESSPLFEIDWTQIQKRIEEHPIFAQAVGSQSAGTYALTPTDRAAIKNWQSLADTNATAYQNLQFVATPGGSPQNLSNNAQELATRLMRGQDSYVLYSPVVHATTYSKDRPQTGGCGAPATPPYPLDLQGYVFLKTADRASYNGKIWTRVQEWTGADWIDTAIYSPNGSFDANAGFDNSDPWAPSS